MKIAIMQPYFFPYIGYWQLISAVDVFIIYDDVTYIKQGFINRNSIIINGEKSYITLELKGASSNKLINEIHLFGNKNKLLKTLEINYKKAPRFFDVFPLIVNIFSFDSNWLIEFLINSLIVISIHLGITTKLLISSKIEKDLSLKGQDKVINICKTLEAKKYINSIGGQYLYNKNDFWDAGIELLFLKSKQISYKQFGEQFIPWLSIIDIMMFNPLDEIKEMLKQYELV